MQDPRAVPTVLYVSRYYRPATAAAGLRAGRFVDALVGAGFRVVVLTAGKPAVTVEGESLVVCRIGGRGELPAEVRGAGGRRWEWWRVLPGPAPDGRWAAGMYRAAQWALETYRPGLIFVTAPPYELPVVVEHLAREKRIPVVLEFRDCWYTGKPWPYRNALRRYLARREERRCLAEAVRVIVTTETHQRLLGEAFGRVLEDKIVTVRHGFDTLAEGMTAQNAATAEGTGRTGLKETTAGGAAERFTVAYVGQLRGLDVVDTSLFQRWARGLAHAAGRVLLGANYCEGLRLDYMSPHYLLAAAAGACEDEPALRGALRLVFAGERFDQIDRWAERWGLAGNVEQLGPIPPERAQALMQQATVLVLSLYGIVGCAYHWCVPSKTYAYLGTGKPILGLLPAGEAADLIRRAGTGVVVSPDDVAGIAERLVMFFREYREGGIRLQPDEAFIRSFAAVRQQERFVEIIRQVWSESVERAG